MAVSLTVFPTPMILIPGRRLVDFWKAQGLGSRLDCAHQIAANYKPKQDCLGGLCPVHTLAGQTARYRCKARHFLPGRK